jgi:hypothetical protein
MAAVMPRERWVSRLTREDHAFVLDLLRRAGAVGAALGGPPAEVPRQEDWE